MAPPSANSACSAVNPCEKLLPRRCLPTRIQIIKVHDRIENERIRSHRRPAIQRIVREQHDVTALEWRVDDYWPLRDVAAAIQQSGHEQFTLIREPKRHARTLIDRNDVQRAAHLLFRR